MVPPRTVKKVEWLTICKFNSSTFFSNVTNKFIFSTESEIVKNANNKIDTINSTDALNSNNSWRESQQCGNFICNNNNWKENIYLYFQIHWCEKLICMYIVSFCRTLISYLSYLVVECFCIHSYVAGVETLFVS